MESSIRIQEITERFFFSVETGSGLLPKELAVILD